MDKSSGTQNLSRPNFKEIDNANRSVERKETEYVIKKNSSLEKKSTAASLAQIFKQTRIILLKLSQNNQRGRLLLVLSHETTAPFQTQKDAPQERKTAWMWRYMSIIPEAAGPVQEDQSLWSD